MCTDVEEDEDKHQADTSLKGNIDTNTSGCMTAVELVEEN